MSGKKVGGWVSPILELQMQLQFDYEMHKFFESWFYFWLIIINISSSKSKTNHIELFLGFYQGSQLINEKKLILSVENVHFKYTVGDSLNAVNVQAGL